MDSNVFMLVDFGSTFTKISLVDLEKERILASGQALTTVESDISIGFKNALNRISEIYDLDKIDIKKTLASSSAAGGLQMVAIGLVPELTMEAARRAALGAGAKVTKTFSFELTSEDLKEIESTNPDIILLAGGIDGGNKKNIVYNAKMLAKTTIDAPIIVAGNRVASEEVKNIFDNSGKETRITKNVMPEIDKLEVDEVRKTIREYFVTHIIKAKGLDKITEYLDDKISPTPAAVLDAAELLAQGKDDEPGFGNVIVVDVGGATTDVHSIAHGKPTTSGVFFKGLEEPFAKRTVEGDLGIRYNASYIVEIYGTQNIVENTGLSEEFINNRISQIKENPGIISKTKEEKVLDKALAEAAVEMAVERHVGVLEKITTPSGEASVQYGKDLTDIKAIIGCGGIFCYGEKPFDILNKATFNQEKPWLLKPKAPSLYLDKEYILAHMGLLKSFHPKSALKILKNSIYESSIYNVKE